MTLQRRFDDLPDDMITEIMSHLSNKELLRVEIVSRSVHRAVTRLLNRVEMVSLFVDSDKKDTCDHISVAKDKYRAVLITSSTSIVDLLERCPQVQCLDLRRVNSFDVLANIVKSCPQLECLCLTEVEATYYKWKKFVEQVGSRLRHLSVRCLYYLNIARLNMLIKACSRLERCHLEDLEDQAMKMLSLNQLPDQTSISLNIANVTNFDNVERVVDVIVRAERLKVDFIALQAIARHRLILDRLRHLTIIDDLADVNNPSMEFPALQSLKFVDLDDENLVLLITHRFPKLRKLHLDGYSNDIEEDQFKTLFNNVRSVKQLILKGSDIFVCSPAPGNSLTTLSQLENLQLDLVICKNDQLPTVTAMFTALGRIKTIRKVRVVLMLHEHSSVPKKVKQQFVSAVGQLKSITPAVDIEIELIYDKFDKKRKRQLNDWNKLFVEQPGMTRCQLVEKAQYYFHVVELVVSFA